MNAYDMLAEIGTGSVQRDTRRRVLGHESLSARHRFAKESRRDPMVEAEATLNRLPSRHGTYVCLLSTVIVGTRAAIGSVLVRVGGLLFTIRNRVKTCGSFVLVTRSAPRRGR